MEALAGIGELDAGLATRRIEIGREILGRADDRGHARAGLGDGVGLHDAAGRLGDLKRVATCHPQNDIIREWES